MSNTFFASDLHLGHENSFAKFKNSDGNPLRPFTSIDEMNETMISNWNQVVRPNDKVYFLGDFVINRKYMYLGLRLNGSKRLVRGNHDIFCIKEYMDIGFSEVYGVRVLDDMILSHIPLHPSCVTRFNKNVHGHLHSNVLNDPTYLNVSVEQTNFTPISIDEVRVRIKQNEEYFANTGHVFNYSLGRLHAASDEYITEGAN
jgi:calcineurin-like phosphoesterase family protein